MLRNFNNNRITYLVVFVILFSLLQFSYLKLMFDIKILFDIILFCSIIAVLLLSLMDMRQSYLRVDKILVFFVIFALWGIASRLYSESIVYASEKSTLFFRIIIFFIIVRSIVYLYFKSNISTMTELFISIIKFNVLILILYIALNWKLIIESISIATRFETDLANPIWLSRFISETILGVALLIKFKKITLKWILLLIPLFFLLIISGSKGPIVSIALSYLISIFIFSDRKKNDIIFLVKKFINFLKNIIIPGLIFILIAIISVNYLPRSFIESRFSIQVALSDIDGLRVDRYLKTLDIIKENFVFGVGLGGWPIEYRGIDVIDYPHNILLELQSETGIVGLFLFLSILWVASTKIMKKNKDYKFIYVFFLYNFFNSMFSGDIASGNRNLFIYLAILSALSIKNKNNILYEKSQNEKFDLL